MRSTRQQQCCHGGRGNLRSFPKNSSSHCLLFHLLCTNCRFQSRCRSRSADLTKKECRSNLMGQEMDHHLMQMDRAWGKMKATRRDMHFHICWSLTLPIERSPSLPSL